MCANCTSENGGRLRIVDKEVRYVKSPSDQGTARPPPIPSSVPKIKLPALPRRTKVPYPWGEDNVYGGDIISYQEPGKPWILSLAFLCRFADDTSVGATDYRTWYRVSNDGGKTFSSLRPLVQSGSGYDLMHPIRPVWAGKNSFVYCGKVMSASNGEIMLPFYFWPLDQKGQPYNPAKAYTFTDAGVLIGKWTKDGSDLVWDLGQTVRIDADQSTRGANEPTIAELKRKGEFMMILRGSNQNKEELPGYKWVSYSRDHCRTWSKPVPFGYSDGKLFFSPSSMSIILRSSKNDRLYWIGNISPTNPRGNKPRYPLVIGEVDEDKGGGLIRESILVIDTRNPEYDSDDVELSNFTVYDDPKTGNILIILQRFDYKLQPYTVPHQDPNEPSDWWTPPSYPTCWYLIEVPQKRQ